MGTAYAKRYADMNPTTLQEADFFQESAAQKYPLGTEICLTDGRKFRYCKNGGSTGVAGRLVQGPAVSGSTANHFAEAVIAGQLSAIGDTEITVTLGATAATLNEYAEGYIYINVGTGIGQSYKVHSHPAADSAAVLTLKLYDSIRVATAASSSEWSLLNHPCDGMIEAPVTTITGPLMGVYTTAVTAAYYCWIQFGGTCCVLISGTLVAGMECGYIQVAGAVGPIAVVTTDPTVGRVLAVDATTDTGLIWLVLP